MGTAAQTAAGVSAGGELGRPRLLELHTRLSHFVFSSLLVLAVLIRDYKEALPCKDRKGRKLILLPIPRQASEYSLAENRPAVFRTA